MNLLLIDNIFLLTLYKIGNLLNPNMVVCLNLSAMT